MEWWSWVLAAMGMTGVYLLGRKKLAGFVVGACVQVPWLVFAIVTAQYGFIFSALGFGYMNLKGIYLWRKDAKKESKES